MEKEEKEGAENSSTTASLPSSSGAAPGKS